MISGKSDKTIYIGEEREVKVEKRTYSFVKDFNPAMYSFGCPLDQEVCGQLQEIYKEFSKRNIFIAIPYSDYDQEDAIKEVLKESGLVPRLAKDRIHSKVLLDKVCKEFRKCAYGIADISKNNLNVIYELGLMQSLGKKCAILFEEGSQRPNDLQGMENVLYCDSNDLKLKLAKWIQDNISDFDKDKLEIYINSLSR